MRISSAALDLVASVELHAHKPAGIVCAELGYEGLDVDQALAAIVRAGGVVKAPFLDPFRLGLTPYTVGFRIAEEFAEGKYLPLVVRAEQVAWLRRHSSPGEFSMGIVAPSLAQVIDLFDGLLIGFRHTVIRRHFGVVESFGFLGHRGLTSAPIERLPLEACTTPITAELDDIDRRVIAALVPRRHFVSEIFARELRMSEEQLGVRIERLRRLEIIRGFTYRFGPEAVRRRRFIVLIRRRTSDLRIKRRFVEMFEQYTDVCAVTNFLGEWDHEVILDVADEAALLRFVDELRRTFGREMTRLWWAEQAEELKSSNWFAL